MRPCSGNGINIYLLTGRKRQYGNSTPTKKKQLPAYLVLAIIALVAAVVLAVTNQVTKGPIQEHQMAALRESFGAVMPADDYVELTVPAGYDVSSLYEARQGGETIGYCVTAVSKGYNGDVAVTLGVGTDGLVTGCAVGDTSFAETPASARGPRRTPSRTSSRASTR